ncbi:Sec23-binding domain of Sec16-domain-containing protein [Exophiala viscosa]|uniref:Sec23-binding domain of Sec16-domain-containing protein n=1 Tax=Exophiala viscosa TaxID=2486360 RepID=UPI002195DCE9|nr:Sec23-binding domain of Sec16-domain-containing protein [Exophiala viscosa]
MEPAIDPNHNSIEASDGPQVGHWLPALRPNTPAQLHDPNTVGNQVKKLPMGFVDEETHIQPPTSTTEENNVADSTNDRTLTYHDQLTDPSETIPGGHTNGIEGNESLPWSQEPIRESVAGDELPSDDDDERLDPAWGIKRLDSAQILDQVHRTATFPEISTSEAPASSHDNATAEDALDTQGPISTAEEEGLDQQPQSLDWAEEERERGREAEAWTVNEQEPTVDEATQRFDEGVPLIQSEDAVDDGSDQETQTPAVKFSEPAHDEEEASFFSNLNGTADQPNGTTEPPQEFPGLDRKTTTQVLDSLHFSSKDAPDSPALPAEPQFGFFEDLARDGGVGSEEQTEPAQAPKAGGADETWAALLDDDEFLVEDADDLLPDSEPGSPSAQASSLQQEPVKKPEEKPNVPAPEASPRTQRLPQRQDSGNPYAPHQPSTSDMFQLSPSRGGTHNNVGISRPELGPMGSFQAQLQQRPPAQTAKSFVDQAKDGYKSPYDLPMDIKPRKRAHVPAPVQTSKTVAPPPRSSSLNENPLQSPFYSNVPPGPATGPLQPPASAPFLQNRSASAFTQPPKPESAKSGSSSFFEELPVPPKARPATGHGRYTPQQNITATPPQLFPQSPPSMHQSPPRPQPSPPRASDPYAQYQMRPPERIDPYANLPLQSAPAAPAVSTTRYSPAPTSLTAPPKPAPTRYSPAPPPAGATNFPTNRYASQQTPPAPAQGPPTMPNRYVSQGPPNVPPPPVLPFQPRTSSPLAFHKRSIDENANDLHAQGRAALLRQVSAAPILQSHTITAPAVSAPVEAYYNNPPPQPPAPDRMPPPRRSQTQSPSKQRPQAAFPAYINDVPNRPASAFGQPAQIRSYAGLETVPPARPQVQTRGPTADLDFVRPVDESQFDPLERWRGAPVFKFGFGGTIVSTFPKHVPRYAAGAARPLIKAAPGDVSLRNTKDTISQDQNMKSFPGPLRTKSKKKELLSWMSDYISGLETVGTGIASSQTLSDPSIRHHEKVLLWKIVRALVEHDGTLDGPALKAVNVILTPEVHALDESAASQYRADQQLAGIYRPPGTNARPDSVDPMAVEGLRKRLLTGDRQGAVFDAMDNRLWSHALIIASTLDRSVWSQVVREFVRQEVKTVGENAESLSALYEIFGGNLEESIDELVPPSARAGLQMVSKVDTSGPTKNALDGLNRWKETLSLVLNNRCPGDHEALAVLGKLLEDYNRIEAAHICYLFSKSPAKPIIFGGVDEEHAPIVLLGVHHRAHPVDFGRDNDGVLLTEIYEFATHILAAGAPTAYMPHLSVYKLQRAKVLADAGQKTEALAYCDAIAATLKSNTKMSPYYHPLFLLELDELTNRLKQTPMQGSSSWIGKPSLEKVSGSMWTKFSSFVAGEDSDAASQGSGKDAAEAGPFANVAGTPSLSRAASQTDLYGPYTQGMPAAVSGSRYAPNGIASSRSSSELTRGRPSLDAQRSPPSTSYSHGNRQYEPTNMLQQGLTRQLTNPYLPNATASPPNSFPQSPPRNSYMPSGMSQSVSAQASPARGQEYIPTPPVEASAQPMYGYMPETVPQPTSQEHPIGYGGFEPVQPEQVQTPPQEHEQPAAGYEPYPQSYGYEPPSDGGYVPYVPEPGSPEEERKEKPKKKSFIDDDDDDFPRITRPTAPGESKPGADDEDEAARKRANDAAADAAFRAAAEADAANEKEKSHAKRSSSSWFGGWLGGKKAAEGLDAGAPAKGGAEAKIYKANLGESKMKLYFDKDLGKWVNPDNPDAAKKTATPPPPPRMGSTPAPPMAPGGPPRAALSSHASTPTIPSMTMGAPSVPGSRTGTPVIGGPNVSSPIPGASGPPSGAGTPPLGSSSNPGLGLAPPLSGPSRPGTAASNASSIDDLIGPATGRKGPKAKKGAKGRYVDVMAQ